MFFRSIKGMGISLVIGILASLISCGIAIIVGGLSATFGGKVDMLVLWIIDLVQGISQLILLIFISIILIKSSTCPLQICVHTSYISEPGPSIICLHHQVIITVKAVNGESDDMIISS